MKRASGEPALEGPIVGYALAEERLEKLCRAQGIGLSCLFKDDQSALTAPLSERPGLVAALKELALLGASGLLVSSFAQLGGRLAWAAVAEVVERQGAALFSLRERVPADEASLDATLGDAKAAFADHPRLVRAVEIRAGQGRRSRAGKRISRHLPYGYRLGEDGDSLVEVPEELSVLERMKALRARGLSYQRVAATLDAEGLPTRKGKPWASSSVRQILRREAEKERGR
ncbi:MAG: recombinase family protein [Alphaproteobacteria bacterium]|nr:recombinase family protein [Alphaproteobacteria bacterium]